MADAIGGRNRVKFFRRFSTNGMQKRHEHMVDAPSYENFQLWIAYAIIEQWISIAIMKSVDGWLGTSRLYFGPIRILRILDITSIET